MFVTKILACSVAKEINCTNKLVLFNSTILQAATSCSFIYTGLRTCLLTQVLIRGQPINVNIHAFSGQQFLCNIPFYLDLLIWYTAGVYLFSFALSHILTHTQRHTETYICRHVIESNLSWAICRLPTVLSSS